MEILGYDKEEKVLFVKYSTHTVWEYLGVDAKNYKDILTIKHSDKAVKKMLRELFIIGVNREGK